MKKTARLALITALCLVFARPASADDGDPEALPWATGYVNLGYYVVGLDSGFRLGTDNLGIGIDINVEEFLGLDSTDTAFRLDAGYRFGKTRRHGVDFSWFGFDRDSTRQVGTEIQLPPELGGGTIPVGTTIDSIFDFDIFKLKYRYSAFLDDRIDLNVGTGLYVMPIEYGLRELGGKFTKEDITAPLPVISVGFDLAITPKWFLRQGLDLMYLKLGDFEGRIMDTHLAVEYRGWKNVALGAGIDGILVKIDAEDETDYPGIDMVGVVKFSYIGALAYVKFYY